MKKITTDKFLEVSKKIQTISYDYSNAICNSSRDYVKIICPTHGEFSQLATEHMKGQGCKKCAIEQRKNNLKLGFDEFKIRAIKKHGDKYDYSLVEYDTLKKKINIICPEHGVFKQRASVHLTGYGCKKCYLKERGINDRLTNDVFIDKAKKIHGDKYDYSLTSYTEHTNYVDIICSKHGVFSQMAQCHLHGSGCQKCSFINTKPEQEIYQFISSLIKDIEIKNRTIIKPLELDMYIPSHNLAIEYNGLYWHSEKYVANDYHLNKTELCEKQGIQLIHIFEDEWLFKQDIVKSRLLNILGLTTNKIYARKCIIKEVSNKETKQFLNDSHIQGLSLSKINFGLYHNNELVSIMTFGGLRINMGTKTKEGVFEMLRFCNKLNTSVIGGADKLLKHFIKTYQPNEIISYADRRWSQGSLYEKLGFEFIHNTKPNYWYILKNKREYRFKYRKDILVEQGYEKNKTAKQIMLDRGIFKIYDCGSKKYNLKLQ